VSLRGSCEVVRLDPVGRDRCVPGPSWLRLSKLLVVAGDGSATGVLGEHPNVMHHPKA